MSDVLDLQKARRKLQEIFDTVSLLRNEFDPLPLLDASASLLPHPRNAVPLEAANTSISGLNAFRESVKHDILAIAKHLARETSNSDAQCDILPPPINAPYLVAVWNEIIKAPPPLLAIGKMFPARLAVHNQVRRSSGNSKSKSVTKSEEVKVDVVADNGRTWIRVNTIKNSRLLAEFREFDSYCTDSDWDSEVDGVQKSPSTQTARLVVVENSIYKMGKSLIETASSQTIVGHTANLPVHPKVILRLTRLRLSHSALTRLCQEGLILTSQLQHVLHDTHVDLEKDFQLDDTQEERTTRIISELIKMDVTVVMGENEDDVHLPNRPSLNADRPRILPTRGINLDLSVLVALVSDISHAPLPTDDDDALNRFIAIEQEQERIDERKRVQKELAAARKVLLHEKKHGPNGKARHANKPQNEYSNTTSKGHHSLSTNTRHSDTNGTSHSRALAHQAIQERRLSLFDEIAQRLHLMSTKETNSDSDGAVDRRDSQVEFWTTPDVRDRFARIVSIIGGPREKRRASALFFNDSSVRALLSLSSNEVVETARRAFWEGTRHSDCGVDVVPVRVFEDYVTQPNTIENDSSRLSGREEFWLAMRRTCLRLLADEPVPHPRSLLDSSMSVLHGTAASSDMERAAVIKSNPRLTAHTVATFLHGASRRWTTLTANRASLKELLKEMSADGWEPKVKGLRVGERVFSQQDGAGDDHSLHDENLEAAIWVVEPRSLAEGMRNDFQA